ncbi:unnamed protein product [Blepharisma stoltei]|uniref:Uncharacterized protein n=1 Tax=Blepharisma stoltei TaxID=1481888 RepID=A0AAU9JNM6_9CILI|nr:unnamed protein product [Blepharisma stoltei]
MHFVINIFLININWYFPYNLLGDNMDQEYDHLFKILIIGDSSVGKTSVLLRFVDDMYSPEFQTTIGVDFKIANLNVNGKVIKLQLWDTAGQDRFRNIVASYYRGAQGIMLMYDITNPTSFQNITRWHEEAQGYLQSSVPKLLIGNKSDLSHQRQVKQDEAQQLAERLGMDYIETSAKSSQNVKQAFENMSKKILSTVSATRPTSTSYAPTSTRVTSGTSIAKTGGCCG